VRGVDRETVSTFDYRALLGLAPAITVFAAALFGLGLNLLLAALLGIAAWVMAARLPNEQQLLWLASEWREASNPRSFVLRKPLDPPKPYDVTSAGAIQVGQYVVSRDECQELRDKNRREEEKRIIRERHADTTLISNEARPTNGSTAPVQASVPDNLPRASWDLTATPQPTVDFALVVVVTHRRAYRLVDLGMTGSGDAEMSVHETDKFYRLRKEEGLPSRQFLTDQDAAAALTDLMEFLTKEHREDRVVAALLGQKHSAEMIRHALRSALAFGLIRRNRPSRSSRIREFIETMKRSASSKRGHEECLIDRTPLGEMWASPPTEDEPQTNTIIIFGNVEYNTSRDDDVLKVLGSVLGLLEDLESRFSEIDDLVAFMSAMATIQSARNEPTLPRTKVKKAVGIILNVCGQLAIGAGGNELYSLLTQLFNLL
jgi:hypothetical protein